MQYPLPPVVVSEGYRFELRRVLGSAAFKHAQRLTLLAWSADEASLLLLDYEVRGHLQRWDARLGMLLETTAVSSHWAYQGHALDAAHAVVWVQRPGGAMVIEAWDLADARVLGVIPVDGGDVHGLAVASEARVVVVEERDRCVARAFPGGEPLGSAPGAGLLAVSADGSTFVTAVRRGEYRIRVWSLDGTLVTEVATEARATRAIFSRDGRAVVVGTKDGSVLCFDAATGAPRWQLAPGHAEVAAFARSPDGATCYALRALDLLEALAPDGRLRWAARLKPGRNLAGVGQVVPSPSGALVAVNADGALRVFDAATGVERSTIDGHPGEVGCLAVSPDGRLVASSACDGDVRVYDATTGDTRWVLEAVAPARGHWPVVSEVEFLRDRDSLRACASDGGLRRWGLARGFEEERLAPAAQVHRFRSAPDGSGVLVIRLDQHLERWSDGRAGGPKWTLPPSDDPGGARGREYCWAAAFGPDAAWVVAVWGRSPFMVETLDARTGERIGGTATLHGGFVALVETDVGPVSIASASDESLVLTEEWGERRARTVPASEEYLAHACLSADRRWLVVGGRHGVTAWDLSASSARLVGRVDLTPLGDSLTALALSPRGNLVAVGTRRGCVLTFALAASD